MQERTIEQIFISGAKYGTIRTLKELNLLNEKILLNKAKELYGKKMIEAWLKNEWIKLYPTGNKTRGKFYVLKSECEQAKCMHSFGEISKNKIDKNILFSNI